MLYSLKKINIQYLKINFDHAINKENLIQLLIQASSAQKKCEKRKKKQIISFNKFIPQEKKKKRKAGVNFLYLPFTSQIHIRILMPLEFLREALHDKKPTTLFSK